MDYLAPWQRPRLEDWESRAVAAGDQPVPRAHFDRYERIVAVEQPGPPEPGGPFEVVAQAVMAFRTFGPAIGLPVIRRSPVQLGDTVGLCYRFLPGLRLFFASRVIRVIDEPGRRGFAYRTLEGHPELGEETFSVVKLPDSGEVRVIIFAWSRPYSWLCRLIAPLARRLQVQAGRAALDHLEGLARTCPT